MLVFEVTDGPLGSGELARKQYADDLVHSIHYNKVNHPELKTVIEVPAGLIWHASQIDVDFAAELKQDEKEESCSTESGESSSAAGTTGA
jgi:hypothetical protein